MNNVSENQTKDRILKSLAVGGFIALIIIIAWLSIKMVAFLPSAVTSLASIADSVYNYKPASITAVSSENVVNTTEPFSVTWNVPTQKGTFAFSHTCVEGVALDIRTNDGEVKNLTCNTNYNIGAVNSIEIIAGSEKERFVDVPYVIDFIPNRSASPTASSSGMITIINASISPIATSTEVVVVTPTEPTIPDIDPVVTPVTPPPVATPTPTPKPVYVQKYIYEIPTSNPKGFVDLQAKFVGTGVIGSNGIFTNTLSIDNDTIGAVQFEVKNFGTKTSEEWNFIAILPNGDTYTSETQNALKPNERAILTVGFAIANTTGTKSFSAVATVDSDTKLSNNSFATTVKVVE